MLLVFYAMLVLFTASVIIEEKLHIYNFCSFNSHRLAYNCTTIWC